MTLRGGLFRIQDWLSVRAHRGDLPHLRRALALEPGSRLLDVGGGTGAYTALFGQGAEEIVVLEPHEARLRYGRLRRPHLRFVSAQAEEIPLPDGHFDRVTTIVSFHHVLRPDRALEEIRRVLKARGRFVVEEFDPNHGRGRRAHAFERTFGGDQSMFYTPEELRSKLEEHGFGGIDHEMVGPGYLLTAET
ncbi:MAG: class I SAM-dependent methyltransferase [Thermoplasmata archaeon]